MKELKFDTLESIISNDSLVINDEDQLISFINELCIENQKYCHFYEFVNFSFVGQERIGEFIEQFDIESITQETWRSISRRLKHDVLLGKDELQETKERYKKPKVQTFSYESDQKFEGILNYLRQISNGKIYNEVGITASTYQNTREPQNVIIFEDQNKEFYTENSTNSWICFDFKERRVIPTHYTLKGHSYGENGDHPKTWVIEGSKDNSKWEVIDEQKNCNFLNGSFYVHTFAISQQNSDEFHYIRMRLTGLNCGNDNKLKLNAFEIYGQLINQLL